MLHPELLSYSVQMLNVIQCEMPKWCEVTDKQTVYLHPLEDVGIELECEFFVALSNRLLKRTSHLIITKVG